MTVSEAAAFFRRPDNQNERDTGPFRYFLKIYSTTDLRPTTLLIEPTTTGWWLIDGIHRAAAFFAARSAVRARKLGLPVFVLPRPLR
jgi:hypothetical protein